MARRRYMFWLDEKKSDDMQIDALIQDLKHDRLFSRAIKEGLQMWVEAQSAQPRTSNPDDGAGQLDNTKVDKLIALLELTVTNQKANGGYSMQSLKPTTGKQIAAPNFAMPNFDDDELPTLSVKKDSKTNASLNFMQSIGGLM